MTVTTHADGSYTVKCGDEEVTVGRTGGGNMPLPTPDRPPAAPGGDNDGGDWPDDPEENDGGVVAYLHVGPQPRPRFPTAPLGGDPFLQPLEILAQPIVRHMPDATPTVRPLGNGVVEVVLRVPPGASFDLAQLTRDAQQVRRQAGARKVRLHVYVEGGAPAPVVFPTQVELP
ncbi:hypothetical protein [Hydrogenophaga sp.]|uniref:hypothetical protein n=1 Tax=Hydrogenophaga sp. TaxID=1904254 RepID=UPI002610641F|nr:hypothetical protein [Hydrogenophaga sp.]MCW5655503.1 hypothetical protein [Hydrogenophaga sp.]